MRTNLFAAAACATLAAACATNAGSPAPGVSDDPRDRRPDASGSQTAEAPPPTTGGSPPASLAEKLLTDIAARVVEAEEHRSGPGYPVLSAVTLYEPPRASQWPGLCEVTAHEVSVAFVPPGDAPEPPPVGRSVRSSTRWAYAGTGRANGAEADARARTEAACRARTTGADFFTAEGGAALEAVSALEDIRIFASDPRMERALTIDCTSAGRPCADGRAIIRGELTPERLRHVRRTPCGDLPGSSETCYELHFRDVGGPGPWVMVIRGPRRPAHVVLRQDMRPVV